MQTTDENFPDHSLMETPQGLVKAAYGLQFPEDMPDYMIELRCALRYRLTPDMGGIGPKNHFWHFVRLMYPAFYHPDNYFMDIFFENVIDKQLDYKHFFCIGPGGFGKTTLAALYAIGTWIENPKETCVITCTSTISSAEGRIWGKVKNLFAKHEEFEDFSRMTDKRIYSRHLSEDGKWRADKFHNMQVSALPRGDAGADQVLRGVHPDSRLIVILDEMDQSAAIDDVIENLTRGGVDFTLIGLGNPSDRFSALGLACEPFGGWGSINPFGFVDIEECAWDSVIDEGRVLFFPGYLNPRIMWTKDKPELTEYYNERFCYFSSEEEIKTKKASIPYNKWMEQYIGFFPEQNTAGMAYILDKKDAERHNSMVLGVFSGHDEPVKLAACDPGFTHGGDETILRFANYGILDSGKLGLCYLGPEKVISITIPRDPGMNKYKWLYQEIVRLLEREGVRPENFAIDANSSGDVLVEYFHNGWSRDIHCIHSKGNATDIPLYIGNSTTARDECQNRVTELWFVIRKFILTNQIRGLEAKTISELSSRAYIVKGNTDRVVLESKTDYKKRMTTIGRRGSSPDRADCAVYLLDLARRKGLLVDHTTGTELNKDAALHAWFNRNMETTEAFLQQRENDRMGELVGQAEDGLEVGGVDMMGYEDMEPVY